MVIAVAETVRLTHDPDADVCIEGRLRNERLAVTTRSHGAGDKTRAARSALIGPEALGRLLALVRRRAIDVGGSDEITFGPAGRHARHGIWLICRYSEG